jgi:hypothetical protein
MQTKSSVLVMVCQFLIVASVLISISISTVSATSMNDLMKSRGVTKSPATPEQNAGAPIAITLAHSCLHNGTELSKHACDIILLPLPVNCAMIDFDYCKDDEIKQYIDIHEKEGVEMYNKYIDEKESK